ncbi:MAG: efflux RND transporter permease subunit, partial [Vicinamibacterales bacterium]
GGGNVARLQAGTYLQQVDALRRVVVAGAGGRSVLLGDVAEVADGDAEPAMYVRYHSRTAGVHPAVTLSVAKRKGANAITVAHLVEQKLETLRGVAVPRDLTLSLTRNYGETAAEKSNELLYHMFLAVISVSVLIGLVLGLREAAVVLIAVPVTLALTLFAFLLYGYTLNRITLFALIFSIGILVDDAIVVVENVVRHARRVTGERSGLAGLTVRAVDEVGNPTILATLTVVAAILPMAFVGGLMGPYMRPIPVGASAAMLFSLAAAFIVTPWAAVRLLRVDHGQRVETEDVLTRRYRRVMARLIASGRTRLFFLGGVAVLLLAAAALVPLQLVTVKMLPFDNKSEFQVVIDMPDGTALEQTARVAADLAGEVLKDPGVTDVQGYVGTAAPYNFNGLVRHYFLRRAPHLADLQVNLLPKDERREQSHDVAKRVRNRLMPMAGRFGATIQVSEVPPGPPVLQTLVAEVYGPDAHRRVELARQVKAVFQQTPGVVDVDWYVEAPQAKIVLAVDQDRASAAGLSPADVATAVRVASGGAQVGLLHDQNAREDVPIVMRLPRASRGSLESLKQLRLEGTHSVALGELTRETHTTEDLSIYHKNLLPVTYVTGDLAGAAESPVYAILQMNEALARVSLPEGYAFEIFNTQQPSDTTKYAMKWDGEWHITYEVFRDLGLAFAAVLVLIYILVVWWFEGFGVPLTIMAAIPFSLIGILPAHALMGAFFTATSMIGFIAGAGIVVRNSIILVDFIEMRVREGMPLAEAVIDAGAVRFRPMALTAAAVIVGSAVILFDPIFQGLAISLMAGEVASLLLSRVTVPVLYYVAHQRRREADGALPSPEPAEALS